MSILIRRWLGHTWVAAVFGVIASVMFGYAVPHCIAEVTAHGQRAPKILDEYFPTWTAADARVLFAALGSAGRTLTSHSTCGWTSGSRCSFWQCSALLSLAFPEGSKRRRLNLLLVVMWLADVAENVNHFQMAVRVPTESAVGLAVGPALTLLKYTLISGVPPVTVLGFAHRALMRSRR